MGWSQTVAAIGRPTLRVHDLRHTCASLWLGAGADPKVVQRVLGHASAAMTMDVHGHLIDQDLWDAAARFGGTTGPGRRVRPGTRKPTTDIWVSGLGLAESRLSASNRRPAGFASAGYGFSRERVRIVSGHTARIWRLYGQDAATASRSIQLGFVPSDDLGIRSKEASYQTTSTLSGASVLRIWPSRRGDGGCNNSTLTSRAGRSTWIPQGVTPSDCSLPAMAWCAWNGDAVSARGQVRLSIGARRTKRSTIPRMNRAKSALGCTLTNSTRKISCMPKPATSGCVTRPR